MTGPVQTGHAHHADHARHASPPVLLNALRLPTVKRLWPEFCERADKEGWPARRLLASLCEIEFQLDERTQQRTQRHLAEARLPQGKTLDNFDFAAVPTVVQARARALAEGDGWLQEGKNLLEFGPPGVGKTHKALYSTRSRLNEHTQVLRVRDSRFDVYFGGELVHPHSRMRPSADGLQSNFRRILPQAHVTFFGGGRNLGLQALAGSGRRRAQ